MAALIVKIKYEGTARLANIAVNMVDMTLVKKQHVRLVRAWVKYSCSKEEIV